MPHRMPQRNTAAWNLRNYLRIFSRYGRRGVAVFLGVLALSVVGLIVWPREYTSEAKLLVRLGRENVSLDPTATTGQVMGMEHSREVEMNSIIEALRSRAIAEQVLDIVGTTTPATTPLEHEKALRKLVKDITVSSPKMSTVIVLSCEANSPERARKIAQTMVDVYTQEHLRVNRTPGSHEFFDQQSKLLKEQLARASEGLRDAKNRYKVVSVEDRRAAMQKQISDIEGEILATASAMAATGAKITAMKQRLGALPRTLARQLVDGTPDSGLGQMRHKLYELQAAEQDALARYTENHPEVVAIRFQVREAQRILEAELPSGSEAAAAVLAVDLAALASHRAKAASLAKQHERLHEDVLVFNEQDLVITRLQRQVNLLDANYDSYAKSLEQARIDQALTNQGISNISVIQSASFEPKPSSPQKLLTLSIAFVLATLGGIGVMLLSDHLDQSLKTSAEVEARLRLPVLISIPRVNGEPATKNERERAHV